MIVDDRRRSTTISKFRIVTVFFIADRRRSSTNETSKLLRFGSTSNVAVFVGTILKFRFFIDDYRRSSTINGDHRRSTTIVEDCTGFAIKV